MGPCGFAVCFDAADSCSGIAGVRKTPGVFPGGKFALSISWTGESTVEKSPSSNHVKEKHPIKRIGHL
jgi:hypothetical protein